MVEQTGRNELEIDRQPPIQVVEEESTAERQTITGEHEQIDTSESSEDLTNPLRRYFLYLILYLILFTGIVLAFIAVAVNEEKAEQLINEIMTRDSVTDAASAWISASPACFDLAYYGDSLTEGGLNLHGFAIQLLAAGSYLFDLDQLCERSLPDELSNIPTHLENVVDGSSELINARITREEVQSEKVTSVVYRIDDLMQEEKHRLRISANEALLTVSRWALSDEQQVEIVDLGSIQNPINVLTRQTRFMHRLGHEYDGSTQSRLPFIADSESVPELEHRYTEDLHRYFLWMDDQGNFRLNLGGNEFPSNVNAMARPMYSLDLNRPITEDDEVNSSFVKYFLPNGIRHQLGVIYTQDELQDYHVPFTALAVVDNQLVVIEIPRGAFLSPDYFNWIIEKLRDEGITQLALEDPDQSFSRGEHQLQTGSHNLETIPPLSGNPELLEQIFKGEGNWVAQLVNHVDRSKSSLWNQQLHQGAFLVIYEPRTSFTWSEYLQVIRDNDRFPESAERISSLISLDRSLVSEILSNFGVQVSEGEVVIKGELVNNGGQESVVLYIGDQEQSWHRLGDLIQEEDGRYRLRLYGLGTVVVSGSETITSVFNSFN